MSEVDKIQFRYNKINFYLENAELQKTFLQSISDVGFSDFIKGYYGALFDGNPNIENEDDIIIYLILHNISALLYFLYDLKVGDRGFDKEIDKWVVAFKNETPYIRNDEFINNRLLMIDLIDFVVNTLEYHYDYK